MDQRELTPSGGKAGEQAEVSSRSGGSPPPGVDDEDRSGRENTVVSAGYVVARGEAKPMKYPCGRVPEERAYYDDLKEGVRMRRPPREAYAALSSFSNFQYALIDFGTSFGGLTAGCPALLQCEEVGRGRKPEELPVPSMLEGDLARDASGALCRAVSCHVDEARGEAEDVTGDRRNDS